MSKHTKEPWAVEHGGVNYGSGLQIDEYFITNRTVCDDVAIASDIIDPTTSKPSEANAKRIVACVNACEGIPNEMLENSMFRGAITLKASYLDLQSQLEASQIREQALKEALNKTAICLENANNAQIIVDTIWISDCETLFDFIGEALTQSPSTDEWIRKSDLEQLAYIHRNEYNEYRLEPTDTFEVKHIEPNIDIKLYRIKDEK